MQFISPFDDENSLVRSQDKVTGQDFFFRVRCTSFHIHSPLRTFFLCFIVLFQSCCSHAQVFGKTLLHDFLIFYSHTEWNLLSSTPILFCGDVPALKYQPTNKISLAQSPLLPQRQRDCPHIVEVSQGATLLNLIQLSYIDASPPLFLNF